MKPTALALAAVLVTGGGASAQSLSDQAKAMLGSWEFSNADRDKICTVTFKNEPLAFGLRVEFEPKCADDFPLVRDITGWNYPDNDLLHLLDAQGKALVDFSEVETGMFEAPTPGVGVLFLQNSADAGAAPTPPAQVAGDWKIMRGGNRLCGVTLSADPVEDGLALVIKPGCDPAIARLNFVRWKIDRDELMLAPARGTPWRFEQDDAKNWQRVPESANPYTMVRD